MDKKSKKSNFLRNLLATASITSVIIGGSSAAFGVARQAQNPASAFNNNLYWNPDVVVGNCDSLVFNGLNIGMVGNANKSVTINNNGIAATTLEVGNNTVDVAGVVGGRELKIKATHANAKIILGLNGVAPETFAVPGEVGVYTGLKIIDFANNDANVVITTNDFNAQVDFLSTEGNNGTVTIDAERVTLSGTWNPVNDNQVKNLVVNNGGSVTIANNLVLNQDVTLNGADGADGAIGGTLTIGANQNVTVREIKGKNNNTGTLIFNGDSTVIAKIGATTGRALKEIRIGNGIVDFQGVAGAVDIKAQEISLTHDNSVIKLSARTQTVIGNITTTSNGQGILQFNGDIAYTVDGTVGASGRELAKISFGATNNRFEDVKTRTITGAVFTNDIDSSGSVINFNDNVYVSGDTNLKAAPTIINIKDNTTANLGRVNFNGFNSKINVGDNANGGTLIGTFENTGADVVGTIHFVGGGIFDGTATRLALIDIANAGVLKFSGGTNIVTDIKATIVGVNFEFADKYELTGNINGTGAGILPNLNFTGDAKLTGGIGNNHYGVGNISIAKDKTLTVNSNAIRAVNIFDKADQGTLTLIQPANVTITSQISPLGGGTIDATGMGASKNLTITGSIGTDPANAGYALEKMLLKGQNLILAPVVSANIAAIDFDKKASTVTFFTPAVGYALGNLTNAENVTLNIDHNITLYNTKTKDKLKETKFLADNTLTLGKDNDITATSITTATTNEGTLVFAGDSALRGPIGTANKKLKAITVNNNVTATTSGPAFVEGDVTLGDEKSVLVIDSNYIVNKFVGGADGVGTLRFVNKDPVELRTTFVPGVVVPPINVIDTLELTEGDVELSAPIGLRFKKIAFTSVAPATTATAPTLFLDRVFKGINVDSNFDTTGNMPTIQLIAGDNIVDKANHVGKDKDHLVNIKLGEKLDVNTKDFFAAVTTGVDGKGKVDFKDKADKIYGLGSKKFKLDTVRLFTDVENFGDTYAKKVVVFADKTYTAGGTISGGKLRLGDSAFNVVMDEIAKRYNNDPVLMAHDIAALVNSKIGQAEGGAITSFNDGVTLLDDVTSVGAGNLLNFAGNAVIKGKIGVSGNVFSGMVTFTGDKDRTATLYSDMYVKVVDFGAETLKVAADQLTIGGVSHVNGTIDLDSNQLILKDTGTWGTNTNISTTLTRSGKLGKIVLNGATVAGDVPVTVKITDYASLKDYRSNEYIFIDGYNHLAMADGSVNIDKIIGGVETNQGYSEWKLRVEGNDLIFTRICDEVKGVKKDLDGIGDDIDQQNAKMLAEMKGGDAAKYLDDINLIDKAQGGKAKRAESLQRLANTESVHVTETIGNTVGHISNIVNVRLWDVTRQQSGIVAAGSDDGSTSMGSWVMPYYSQAVQKNKGGSVGYAVKSGGGVFGFDTLANENLTIGAAVSIIKSNMKFKGYKAGEKTAIDTLMLSIYGSQQLAKDFFVQAVASFGSSKVKNTDPRIVSVNTHASGMQTAKASYNSMSYGGELLFGYNAKIDDSVLLTPMAGIRYTRFNGEGYKETGTTSQNKDIRQKASNRVEAIVGARVATTVDTSGITVTPEVHAFVSQKLSGKSEKVDARLDGMTSPFTTRPDKGAKTSFNVGVGVNAKAGVMEYGVGYDAHLANKYVGHQGTLKVRVNF